MANNEDHTGLNLNNQSVTLSLEAFTNLNTRLAALEQPNAAHGSSRGYPRSRSRR